MALRTIPAIHLRETIGRLVVKLDHYRNAPRRVDLSVTHALSNAGHDIRTIPGYLERRDVSTQVIAKHVLGYPAPIARILRYPDLRIRVRPRFGDKSRGCRELHVQ